MKKKKRKVIYFYKKKLYKLMKKATGYDFTNLRDIKLKIFFLNHRKIYSLFNIL